MPVPVPVPGAPLAPGPWTAPVGPAEIQQGEDMHGGGIWDSIGAGAVALRATKRGRRLRRVEKYILYLGGLVGRRKTKVSSSLEY